MDAGFGLWGDEVHHHAVGFVLGGGFVAALACQGHAHFNQHMTGRREAADLPAVHQLVIGQIVCPQRHLPKRWGLDVLHETTGHHLVAIHRGLTGGFVNFGLANAGGVHIGFVRQVHQVIDHQAVIAGNVIMPAAVGPVRIFKPFKHGHGRFIGQVGVARPDPNKTVTLDHRKTLDRRKAAHPLAWHGHGLSVATHLQAVVTADQFAIAHFAQRQRGAAVRAEVFDGCDFVFKAAKESNAFTTDLACQRLVRQFVGLTGHVPGVFQKHTHPFKSSNRAHAKRPINGRVIQVGPLTLAQNRCEPPDLGRAPRHGD